MLELFQKSNHQMYMFSHDHIQALLISFILCIILFIIAIFFNKKKYATFLGYFIIIIKLVDIFYRIFVEKQFATVDALPFHLCNMTILVAGLYMITKSKLLFNISYHLTYASLIVLLIPASFSYSTSFYIVLYMFTHMLEWLVVFYNKMFLHTKVTTKGLIETFVFYILLLLNATFFNHMLHTNFMYVSNYILPVFSRFPFTVYLIVFLGLNFIAMVVMNKLKKVLS